MKNFTLNNGLLIPEIGFGTWGLEEGEQAYNTVATALKEGYTLIDTASRYRNEASVANAIKDSNIKREELFIVTKLWNDMRGYDNAKKGFEESLEKMKLDYLDLYLLHWPANEKQYPNNWKEINADSWKALEDLYKEGKVRAIGVSNFLVHHLEALLETAEIVPAINQIEFHPGYVQKEIVEYCKEKNILVEAWSPLGSGRVLQDETVVRIAEKYNVSTGQVCIKFVQQEGVLPLPRSKNPVNIKKNLILDFKLTQEEIKELRTIKEVGFSGNHPDLVEF